MKKLTLSIVAVMAMSTFAIAGGDIAPVEEPMVEVVEPVVNDSGFYLGLGYSYMDLNVDFGGDSEANIDGNALTVIAGYKFNRYFAAEGRYSTTFGDLTFEGTSHGHTGAEIDIDAGISNIALYLKPMYPVTEEFNVYALLGYGQVSMEVGGSDPDGSENGFQWGLGASYAVNDSIGLFLDYTRLYDDEGFDNFGDDEDALLDSINFGVTYKF